MPVIILSLIMFSIILVYYGIVNLMIYLIERMTK